MEASPAKAVIEELEILRGGARTLSARYLAQLENQIGQLRARVLSADGQNARTRDLRDMLMLMRGLDLKPEAGRRKDFKKIENAIAELQLLSQKW